MKKLLKAANIGFYILMLLTFFVLGLYFAAMIDAGKNQGLAGGAIVLGWGVLFGGIAFIASFFVAYFLEIKTIVRINWILLILLLFSLGYKYYQFQQRDKLQEERNRPYQQVPKTQTETGEPTAMLTYTETKNNTQEENHMGMGFFEPNFYENPVIYFYGDPNLEKSLMDHTPYDSLTFKRNKYNQFEIATAPPWLVPDILKLDYDLLYFRIKSITEEFVEVVVNTQNGQTSFVSRRAGNVVYWPDFLLHVNSVEFLPNSKEKVKVRPFEESGINNVPHEFMRPVQIKNEWMQVLLLDGNFKKVGKGWIQWKRDGKLLIMYNLFS